MDLDRFQYLILMGLCLVDHPAPGAAPGRPGVAPSPAACWRRLADPGGGVRGLGRRRHRPRPLDLQPPATSPAGTCGNLPVEELVFFVVIPICGLLTYEAVRRILHRAGRRVGPAAAPGPALGADVEYTWAAVGGVVAVVLLEVLWLRTGIFAHRHLLDRLRDRRVLPGAGGRVADQAVGAHRRSTTRTSSPAGGRPSTSPWRTTCSASPWSRSRS